MTLLDLPWLLIQLWTGYLASSTLYRAWLAGLIRRYSVTFWCAGLFILGFIVVDWELNQTLARLVFWDDAASARELLTGRFTRYLGDPQAGWYRRGVAALVCHNFLDPFHFLPEAHCA